MDPSAYFAAVEERAAASSPYLRRYAYGLDIRTLTTSEAAIAVRPDHDRRDPQSFYGTCARCKRITVMDGGYSVCRDCRTAAGRKR